MDQRPQFPPRPPMPPLGHIETTYCDALQAWLEAHFTYWACDECVVLPKVAVNAMRTVANWRRGPNAVDTLLPAGTPVATFMGRKGQPSTHWDGAEGLGITGNQTTHSGVVAGYALDATGQITGLKLWEIYPGCQHVRRRIYPVDDTLFGTANARNYFGIMEPDGRPLGGRDNPCFKAWAAQQTRGPACA